MFLDVCKRLNGWTVLCISLPITALLILSATTLARGASHSTEWKNAALPVEAIIQAFFDVDSPADQTELRFFDSVDTEVVGVAELSPEGWRATGLDLDSLVQGHTYGFYLCGREDGTAEAVCSDTVFVTAESLRRQIGTSRGAAEQPDMKTGAVETSVAPPAHNYPNPFNPNEESTTIVFEPNRNDVITMQIYDLFGHLVYEEIGLRADHLSWDGRNGRGELAASGGYICVLKMDGEVVSKHKIAVIK